MPEPPDVGAHLPSLERQRRMNVRDSTAVCTAPTGNGSPPDDPTIADLRMLTDAYEAALQAKDRSYAG